MDAVLGRYEPPMRHITLVNGMSNYDLMRTFTDEMRYAFEQLGCSTQMIDAARHPSPAECQKALDRHGPHLLFGFNASGFALKRPNGEPLPSADHPYFNFMVDGPMFHAHWVPFMRQPHVYSGLCDPTHRHGALRLGIPAERLIDVRHGGHVSPLAREDERTTDIAVLGTIGDFEAQRTALKATLPEGVFRVFELVAESWSSNLQLGLYDVFDAVVAELGLELDDEQRLNLEFIVCSNVDRYIRNRERLRILKGFSDLPIRIFGHGWRRLITWNHRFDIGPELSFAQAQEELCRTKVLINIQPIAVHATTERALNALLNGAVLVTTVNHFLSRHFVAGEQFFPFSSDAAGFDQARGQVENLLSNPARRVEIYENARQAALAAHTWKHRAQEILELTKHGARPRADVFTA